MKKLIAGLLFGVAFSAFGQTFPINNLTVAGSASFAQSPTAPTPSPGDSSNKLATTAFIGGFAPTASPTFTGIPVGPTAAAGTNTTQLATTQFVAQHSPCVSILDYGGNNTASANNDTAYQAALIAAGNSSSQICVYFPAGTYNFSANAAYSFPNGPSSVVLAGAGQEATVLQWAAGGGLTFNYQIAANTVTIRDLTVATATTNTGNGIWLKQTAAGIAASAVNTIQNVTVRGADGFYGTDYWADAIFLNGVSNVNLVGVTIAGTSGTVHGNGVVTGASILGIVYNLTNLNIVGMNQAFVYGNNVQGVQITNANFTGNNIGVLVSGSSTNTSELNIMGSQFSNISSDVDLAAGVPGVQLVGNMFLVRNNANSVVFSATSHTVISGNVFAPNSGSPSNLNGISIGGWAVGGTVIVANTFYSLTTAVNLTASSKNVNVQSNLYQGNVTNTINNGTSNVIGGGSP